MSLVLITDPIEFIRSCCLKTFRSSPSTPPTAFRYNLRLLLTHVDNFFDNDDAGLTDFLNPGFMLHHTTPAISMHVIADWLAKNKKFMVLPYAYANGLNEEVDGRTVVLYMAVDDLNLTQDEFDKTIEHLRRHGVGIDTELKTRPDMPVHSSVNSAGRIHAPHVAGEKRTVIGAEVYGESRAPADSAVGSKLPQGNTAGKSGW